MRRCGHRTRAFGALLAAAVLAGCAEEARSPARSLDAPPDLLLITLDTFRADRAGCYGNPGGWTPHLDRAVRDGWLARNAFTSAPLTAIAHATLLTGLPPYRHGVRENGLFRLDASIPTLATHLGAHGFRTAAFIAAFPLESQFGFANGFATFDEDLGPGDETGLHYAERPARQVVDRALAWLAQCDPRERVFVWTHFFDPHQPYRPPGVFRKLPGGSDYEREIRGMDEEIGRLLRGVESQGRHPVLVIASDHGEGLLDHGEASHGILLHAETMHGFLGIRAPASSPVEARVHGVYEPVLPYADVAPTLLSALGSPPLPDTDGTSALTGPPAEGAYGETYYPMLHYGWSPLLSWRNDAWAFLDGPVPELYDRRADPGETQDVAGAHPDVVRSLHAGLGEVARMPPRTEEGLDEETREKLGALGYVGAPARATYDATKNPKDYLDMINDLFRGMLLAGEGRFREALPPLQRAYRADPENAMTLFHLANCLRELGQTDAAMGYYRKAVDTDPHADGAWSHLALLRFERGQPEEAFRLLAEGRRSNPSSFVLGMTSGDLLSEVGRADEARIDYEKAAALAPRQRAPWSALARLAEQRGDAAEARRLAARADSLGPAPGGSR